MEVQSNFQEEFDEDIVSSFLKKTEPFQEDVNCKLLLASKIIDGMKAKGWNKSEFAKQMKVQNSIISRWLSGTHNFNLDTLLAIQKNLNINLLDLDRNSINTNLIVVADPTKNINVFIQTSTDNPKSALRKGGFTFIAPLFPNDTIQITECGDMITN